VVNIAARLRGGESGIEILAGARDFSSTECSAWLRGPPSLWFSVWWVLFLGDLLLQLRMSEAVLPLLLYAIMADA
jgi:hypothetical protein